MGRSQVSVQRQNWNRVVFSDESRFCLSFADGRARIYPRRNERITVMDWPAVSPDMNMWDEHGRRVRKRQNQPNNVTELGRARQEEWSNIPVATVRRLVGSIRRRLQTVIQKNGGHNRY